MKQIIKSLYQNSRNKEVIELIFNAFNKDWEVCNYVAKNTRTPASILEKLSKDENENVCLQAIENLNYKKSRNKNPWFYYLKDLFYNLFKKKKKEGE